MPQPPLGPVYVLVCSIRLVLSEQVGFGSENFHYVGLFWKYLP